MRKLYALVSGKIINDDSDSLANHEVMMRGHFAACRMQHVRRLATQVMLPGHLIGAFVKEKLQDMLETLKLQVGAPDPTRPVEGGRSHLRRVCGCMAGCSACRHTYRRRQHGTEQTCTILCTTCNAPNARDWRAFAMR